MSRLYGVLIILLISTISFIESEDEAQVRLVSVVFRHGDKAPNGNGNKMYPNDPHLNNEFLPGGLGALTENGKERERNLGKFLRNRYVPSLLGNSYEPEDIDAQTSDYERTRMSLALVLDGLYDLAQAQQWNQRIDPGLALIPEKCLSRYFEELYRVLGLPEVVEKIKQLEPSMKELTELTGKTIDNTFEMSFLYHTLTSESSMGLELPEWTNRYFPNGKLYDGIILTYEVLNYNDKLKKLNTGGAILKRISDDMNGIVNGIETKARKMNLFSGHEVSVVALLKILGIYKPHVPEYGSAVIVELLSKGSEYYVKVLYYHGIPDTVEEMEIPGCNKLCPLDNFLQLLEKVTPTDDDLQC